MALFNRVVKSGLNSAIFFTKSGAINTSSSSSSFCNRFNHRHISQLATPNNKRLLVDTLALISTDNLMALCNRVVKSGVNSAISLAKSRAINTSSSSSSLSSLVKSDNKHTSLVDTLALRLGGTTSKQAEAITAAIAKVLNDSLEVVAHTYVSKSEMHKSEMIQECNLSKFKSELQSSQEHHSSVSHHETEKLRGYIEKMCSELRCQICDAQMLTDKEVHASKYDVIKFCVGTFVSIAQLELQQSVS